MSITDLEKQHVGLKMKCSEVNNHTSTIMLLCQAIQDQQQLIGMLTKHSEALIDRLKADNEDKKDPNQTRGAVPGAPQAAT